MAVVGGPGSLRWLCLVLCSPQCPCSCSCSCSCSCFCSCALPAAPGFVYWQLMHTTHTHLPGQSLFDQAITYTTTNHHHRTTTASAEKHRSSADALAARPSLALWEGTRQACGLSPLPSRPPWTFAAATGL
jgi:hypothetical protein